MMQALKSKAAGFQLGVGLLLLSSSLAACGPGAVNGAGNLRVVAAENFWGNLAAQLGGSRVSVNSILSNPNTDPHEYESSAEDARIFATADYVIVNGAGYDDWAQKLLDANPNSSRKVLDVAKLLGKKAGDNPHFWYSPTYVTQVTEQINADYQSLTSVNLAYFQQRLEELRAALQPYYNLRDRIGKVYPATPVASTESIFVYMAQQLNLDLRSPAEFMKAISEGTDPSAQSLAAFENQLNQHQVRVLVVNRQTSSPITDRLQQLARQDGIPIVTVTETMPAGKTFQDWQIQQLQALQAALA